MKFPGYCECDNPDVQIVEYRERPITLIFARVGEEYKGPRSKMVPIKRCLICGKHPRHNRCPECANFEHQQEARFNDFCTACQLSDYYLFEKVRTFKEGDALDRKYWDMEIEIENIRTMAPTPEQLEAFYKVYPDWKGEPFNQYRKIKFTAFCQGWGYATSEILNADFREVNE